MIDIFFKYIVICSIKIYLTCVFEILFAVLFCKNGKLTSTYVVLLIIKYNLNRTNL